MDSLDAILNEDFVSDHDDNGVEQPMGEVGSGPVQDRLGVVSTTTKRRTVRVMQRALQSAGYRSEELGREFCSLILGIAQSTMDAGTASSTPGLVREHFEKHPELSKYIDTLWRAKMLRVRKWVRCTNPGCKRRARDGAPFCRYCPDSSPPPRAVRKCEKCGKRAWRATKYCKTCGISVASVSRTIEERPIVTRQQTFATIAQNAASVDPQQIASNFTAYEEMEKL